MGSFPGNCEIVEATEELNTGKLAGNYQPNSEVSWKHTMPTKLANKDNFDDDINKLFESVRFRNSSRDLGLLQDGSTPKMKNALKKPITGGVARSPRIGTSEPVTLKQALRDQCILKASEMAAMKRLSKSINSPRVSEVGKIKTLYNLVVAEASGSGPSFVENKGVSLVSEDSKSISLEKASQSQQTSKTLTYCQNIHSSAKPAMATSQKDTGTSEAQSDTVYPSIRVVVQSQRLEPAQTDNQSCSPSPSFSNTDGSKLHLFESASTSKKIGNGASVLIGSSQAASSSSTLINGNRVNKLSCNAPHTVKSIISNKNMSEKKQKQDSGTALRAPTSNQKNKKSVPGKSQLICEKCRCALETDSKESGQNSIASDSTSPGDVVDSNNVNCGADKPNLTSTSCNRNVEVAEVEKNTRLREPPEFSQSSESSQGDRSSITSTSDDSNVSGSTCGHRPHMSKDVRWEAIRQAQRQHGVLGLRHFNLLKKLGCGDIGTVYLAELAGTNCMFAIKVMDNELLARRKKMPRAQTEREILRMLDHPFLPTLYAQFTSGNLSCLVMEYCPGGDLHVLRQKQLGRSFSEPAARFYVAEVLLALEYLHMIGVVYRDLKPENILVREDGHIMLSDFDLSLRCAVSPTLLKSSSDFDLPKISGPRIQSNCIEPFCIEPSCHVPCFSPRFLPATAKPRKQKSDLSTRIRSLPQLVAEPTEARSNSFVGTHEYLAPEIIQGEGHGAAVDWWTFGVFLYELLYGRTPFKGSNNEETLVNVVLQSLKFPETPFVSVQARDLIKGLLVKEPENRLGSERGAAEIKQHPFFGGLNWALIRCAVPPEPPDYCDLAVADMTTQASKYLECGATREHVEFELF